MNTLNRLTDKHIADLKIDLASFSAQKPTTIPTVVDNDILIEEHLTSFTIKVDMILDDNTTQNLDLDVVFHQVEDEWCGFLVRKVTPTTPTESPFFADLSFKQRIQGILSSTTELLDSLLQPVIAY